MVHANTAEIADIEHALGVLTRTINEHSAQQGIPNEAVSDAAQNFYPKFLAGRVYMLLHEPLPPDQVIDDLEVVFAGRDIPVFTVTLENGEACVPIFTSMDRVLAYLKASLFQAYYCYPRGFDVLNLVRGTDVFINGLDADRLFLSKNEIENVLEFFKPKDIVTQECGQVTLGRPEVDPVGLKDTLSKIFRIHPEIEAAHLCLCLNQEGDVEQYSYLIFIDMPEGETMRYVIESAATEAYGWLPKGYFIDFVCPSTAPDLVQGVIEHGACFYRKP